MAEVKAYKETPLRKYLALFGGGLQTQEEPNKIADNASPEMINVRPIGQGAYGPRNGISRVGNELTGVGSRKSIWNFSKLGTEKLVASRATTLEYLKVSNDTWTAVPGVPVYTDSQHFGFANDKKYLYFCNAVEDFAIWDGKDLTATFTAAVDNTITSAAHGLALNDIVVFTTTTTLPAGLALNTAYFVISVTTDTFKVSTTFSGTEVDITDTGTGVHTFASSVKTYPSNPKGNIMEFYLNRLFVAGVSGDNQATVYYSVINVLGANPSFDFASAGSGSFTVGASGDRITALQTFRSPTTGKKSLFIFKESSEIYEMYFDDSGNRILEEVKSGTGAVNDKSTINVENDIIYIDNGNNIANMGYRENLQDELRTDSTTAGLDRTTTALDFSDSAAVYWKKRRIALYSAKSFGSTFNDVVLAYFYDFKSWWKWSGINASQFAVYNDEIVWASSIDKNVYKYDESKFDDLDGNIQSYRHSKDIEFANRDGIAYSDRFKKARWATFRGFISPGYIDENGVRFGGVMDIGVIYDANLDTKSIVTFTGSDPDITTENVAIYFGANILGSSAFGGTALSPSAFPMREFFAVVSLDYYSHLRARLVTEVQGAGAPYVITHQALYAELTEIESWPDGARI